MVALLGAVYVFIGLLDCIVLLLYCLVIGKAGARCDQVGKSRKKAHKGYPRFVEEKISKQKKPLHNFWPSLIATF